MRATGIEPALSWMEARCLTIRHRQQRALDRHRTGNHAHTKRALFSLSFEGIMDLEGSAPSASCVQNRRSPE